MCRKHSRRPGEGCGHVLVGQEFTLPQAGPGPPTTLGKPRNTGLIQPPEREGAAGAQRQGSSRFLPLVLGLSSGRQLSAVMIQKVITGRPRARGLPAACWPGPLHGLTLRTRPKIGKPRDGPEAQHPGCFRLRWTWLPSGSQPALLCSHSAC